MRECAQDLDLFQIERVVMMLRGELKLLLGVEFCFLLGLEREVDLE